MGGSGDHVRVEAQRVRNHQRERIHQNDDRRLVSGAVPSQILIDCILLSTRMGPFCYLSHRIGHQRLHPLYQVGILVCRAQLDCEEYALPP